MNKCCNRCLHYSRPDGIMGISGFCQISKELINLKASSYNCQDFKSDKNRLILYLFLSIASFSGMFYAVSKCLIMISPYWIILIGICMFICSITTAYLFENIS